MVHILPIGSVVKVREYKLCLLGARLEEREGKYVLAYCAVKHPRGFAGGDSVGLIPASAIEEVLFVGSEGAGGKKYRERLEKLFGTMVDRSSEEIMEMVKPENLKKSLEEMEKDGSSDEE